MKEYIKERITEGYENEILNLNELKEIISILTENYLKYFKMYKYVFAHDQASTYEQKELFV